ncbi:hypothetical protein AAG906_017389 [Vitis piasezkii]
MNSEEESVSLGPLKKKMAEFAKERDWDQFHSLRNLLLALWREEVLKELLDWKEEEKQHLGEELSDICDIDLGKVALCKVDLNAIKHPVSKTNLYNEGS